MNVIDSSGWLEYFIGGKNADFFASVTLLQKGLNATFVSRKWEKVGKKAQNTYYLPIKVPKKSSMWERIICNF